MFTKTKRPHGPYHRILRYINIYDPRSLASQLLEKGYLCVVFYCIFYVAAWYCFKAIRQLEDFNKEKLSFAEKNRARLSDVIALKNKRAEYDEMIIKKKNAHKLTTKQLDSDMKRLGAELVDSENKINELEKALLEWTGWDNVDRMLEKPANVDYKDGKTALESTHPSMTPSEPPPRKFGVFTRPPTGSAGVSLKVGWR